MKNIAKLPISAYPDCLLALLLLACSGGVDEPESDSRDASGSGGQVAESSTGGTGGAHSLPPGGSRGDSQAQAGVGGADNAGGTSSGGTSGAGPEGGSAGAPQVEPNTDGDARWHCIGTMGDLACSCVLARTEPVAPYESGCPSDAQYGCCYTSQSFNPDDACSCWTDAGLMQLGQTCEELLQLAEAAGATRVDACSND